MSEAVRAFFSQWDIYRLCIEHNTLFHREVGAILRRELQEQSRPFTFLDLACGDAEVTAAALRETKVTAYTGVDFSAPAIALATEKTAALACPCRFREQDFTHFLRDNKEKFDLIFAGPPYPLPTLPDIPDLIFEYDLVEGEGWFIMEHNPQHNFKKHPHYLKQKKYGQTIFSIFTNAGKN